MCDKMGVVIYAVNERELFSGTAAIASALRLRAPSAQRAAKEQSVMPVMPVKSSARGGISQETGSRKSAGDFNLH
jgi:hypothetical protein